MAYDNWTISDITVPHVRSYKHDKNSRTITLNCSALIENTTPLDVRTEIAQWEAIACDVINNTQLIQGGSCLEVCNCDPVLVSDGEDAWVGALLQPVINEHKTSHKRLDYDLIIIYETTGRNVSYATTGSLDGSSVDESSEPDSTDLSSKRYYPGYCGRSNINYYRYTDMTTTMGCVLIGKLVITETRKVNKVVINVLPAGLGVDTWVEVNGVRQNYAYSGNRTDQIMTWNLSTSTYTVTINTDTNTDDPTLEANYTFMENSKSIWPEWIEVYYE